MKEKYKIKVTKKLLKQLKPFWKNLGDIEDKFYKQMGLLEKEMENKTGIKSIEFFRCDNEVVGIGNAERTMRLIRGHELEI